MDYKFTAKSVVWPFTYRPIRRITLVFLFPWLILLFFISSIIKGVLIGSACFIDNCEYLYKKSLFGWKWYVGSDGKIKEE